MCFTKKLFLKFIVKQIMSIYFIYNKTNRCQIANLQILTTDFWTIKIFFNPYIILSL